MVLSFKTWVFSFLAICFEILLSESKICSNCSSPFGYAWRNPIFKSKMISRPSRFYLMNWQMISFIKDAESSESVRLAEPISVRDSFVVAIFGTFRDNGEMFVSFYLNLNLPELTKSKCGTNIT